MEPVAQTWQSFAATDAYRASGILSLHSHIESIVRPCFTPVQLNHDVGIISQRDADRCSCQRVTFPRGVSGWQCGVKLY